MTRTVLIDADIAAYQVASSQEQEFTFGDQTVYHTDVENAIAEVNNLIEWIIDMTDSDQAALFLTGTKNFRADVLPTYKGNRKDVRKPEALGALRDHIMSLPMSFMEDTLEGDNLIGIHATKPHKGERIIYSADKDLKTVPGLHWCPEDGEVIEISHHEADRKFFEQVLTGDPVDNYSGCPKVGIVGATEMLDEPFMWVPYTHTFKSGPRKGLEETRWEKAPVEVHNYIDIWRCIVSAYEKAGLTEQDALVQARCARILRHGEYAFETKKVKLWTP
ncbi:exonuclease [Marinobacterium sp. xm-d-509]|uniref:exonuclease n=1 Tax=Marinobacterium sp. xm-d-509 TaxID=2497739 RepID=UPI0015691952|nr:exonuclease [Marinobacterium sp. xm-d-509]NRP84102.1 DNA polymerase I [Marinobacterium sp. xm-d-509]